MSRFILQTVAVELPKLDAEYSNGLGSMEIQDKQTAATVTDNESLLFKAIAFNNKTRRNNDLQQNEWKCENYS